MGRSALGSFFKVFRNWVLYRTLQGPGWHLYLFIAGILKLSSLLLSVEMATGQAVAPKIRRTSRGTSTIGDLVMDSRPSYGLWYIHIYGKSPSYGMGQCSYLSQQLFRGAVDPMGLKCCPQKEQNKRFFRIFFMIELLARAWS